MKYLLYFLLTGCLAACAPSQSGLGTRTAPQTDNGAIHSSQVPPQPIDLTDFLKRMSGVQIVGAGPDARFVIRGVTSINLPTDPLFVVDGVNVGTDYSVVYNAVQAQSIKSVRVLKSGSETSMYGVQGAAGVIEIYMK